MEFGILLQDMNSPPTATLYDKIGRLERELQRLKVAAYFALPPRKRISRYPQRAILQALRDTRRQIWRKRYATKIARVS